MKWLLGLVLGISLQAQSIRVNPVQVYKALHNRTSPSTKIRRITEIVVVGFDIADWRTTYIGVDRGFCELNPLLVTKPCILNRPKLNLVKGAVIGVVGLEEAYSYKWGTDNSNKVITILNVAGAIPLGTAVINNIYQLNK